MFPENHLCLADEVPEPEFLIGLLFTGAVFCVGTFITLLTLCSLLRNKSSRVKWALAFVPLGCGTVVFAPFFLLLLSWIAYWVLPRHKITQGEVVRQYHGTICGAQESLNIRADGSFSQALETPNGKHYEQQGTWKLRDENIELSQYYEPYDVEHKKLWIEPMLFTGYTYKYYYGDKALIIDWGSEHYTLQGK